MKLAHYPYFDDRFLFVLAPDPFFVLFLVVVDKGTARFLGKNTFTMIESFVCLTIVGVSILRSYHAARAPATLWSEGGGLCKHLPPYPWVIKSPSEPVFQRGYLL